MKMNKMSFWILLSAVAMSIMFSSCTKDSTEPYLPAPAGIVIITPEIIIGNGNIGELIFRVNPSNYQIDVNKLHLDAREESSTTRATLPNVSENFEIISVAANEDESGTVIEGEWKAEIKTIEGNPFIGESELNLILDFYDNNNELASITSPVVYVYTVPILTDNMISLAYFKSQSLRSLTSERIYPNVISPSDVILSSRVLYDFNTLHSGTNVKYRETFLESVSYASVGDNAEYFTVEEVSSQVFDIVPVIEKIDRYFEDNANALTIKSTVEVTFVDIFGTQLVKTISVDFFKNNTYIYPAGERFSFTRATLNEAGFDNEIDITQGLINTGFTTELLSSENARSILVDLGAGLMPGGYEAFGYGFDLGTAVEDYISTGIYTANLLLAVEDASIPLGNHYGVVRMIITNPRTMSVVVSVDICQEIILVD